MFRRFAGNDRIPLCGVAIQSVCPRQGLVAHAGRSGYARQGHEDEEGCGDAQTNREIGRHDFHMTRIRFYTDSILSTPSAWVLEFTVAAILLVAGLALYVGMP